jgi:hypothetical protein
MNALPKSVQAEMLFRHFSHNPSQIGINGLRAVEQTWAEKKGFAMARVDEQSRRLAFDR